MNRVSVDTARRLDAFAFLRRAAWLVSGALLFVITTQQEAHAITINMTYFNEGDPVPHDENPTWDPDGTILKAHFQAAKTIWESLLPGGGSYDFDFEWDDDIDGLGLTTGSITGAFIEIHPSPVTSTGTPVSWFADPTPNDNVEFNAATQRLYSQLSASDQSFYFPGTAPPGALEVNFQGTGLPNGTFVNGVPVDTLSASGQTIPGTGTAVDASNGYDLLSTIVHEIGHVLGISGEEPGDYNIDPQHVGGLNNVLVLEGGGGHLGGGPVPPPNTNIVPGFLMCNSCGVPGLRRFATATDVLVIAEDQGITVVQLARVGSIANGVWSATSNWIGGDVPDGTQDVYITHGGVVTVDVGAHANNVIVAPGNGLAIQTGQSSLVFGTLTFTGGTLTVGPGGSIAANALIGNPSSITSAAGSLVRFNQLSETAATSASFGGSVAIGFDTDLSGLIPLTPPFNPSLATWNIAENLIVSDENYTDLIVDNGIWTVNGNFELGRIMTVTGGGYAGTVTLQNNATMSVGGNVTVEGPLSTVIVEDTAALNIAGNVAIDKVGRFIYRDDRKAEYITYSLAGGQTVVVSGPVGPPSLFRGQGGTLKFEDSASAGDATVIVEGGAGDDAPGAQVVFSDDSSAGDTLPFARALFRTKGGRRGPTLGGFEVAGNGGVVSFGSTSGARDSTFVNEGGAEYFGGTGGRTIFTQNSSAENSIIDNHGATYFNAGGGTTHFFGYSTAGSATITNHADGTYYVFDTVAGTTFFEFSAADHATIENLGSPNQTNSPGRTEFRGNSSAALSNIHNRGHLTPGGLAGRTLFYDSATAADATIHTYEGYSDLGRIEFYNQSTAARARIIVENVPASPSSGGYVNFFDNSTAAKSQIFLRAGTSGYGGLQFYGNATAADAQILTEDGSGNIAFLGNSTAGDPVTAPTAETSIISLGRGSVMSFYDQSKAEDAVITLAGGSQLFFQNHSSAVGAQIVAAGSSVYPISGAAITFNSTSLVNNTNITLSGGTASLATGATVAFINGSHAGNSTISANGGSNGGGGAQITFSNAYGDTAQIIANAGSTVDFIVQPTFNNGITTLGSIEGAGSYILRGSHLIAGSRNASTTVSGPIKDNPNSNPFYSGGRLTKIGTGTLTLAGINNYSGLTTVNAGTLSVTGSITGGAVVNSGSTLNGAGTIGGTVTVNSGGTLAPGTSIGMISLGALSMTSGGILDFELGQSSYDRIAATGNASLAGVLNVSLVGGFTPVAGNNFNILDWNSITGSFNTVNLPALTSGLNWNTSQLYLTGVLSIMADLPGDFNHDGKVDAADYVVWRKTNGTPAGFNAWRANFGQAAAGGAGSVGTTDATAAVPEPAARVLVLIGLAFLTFIGNSYARERINS